MAKKTETKTPAANYEIGQDIVITCSPRSIHYRREYNDCIATIVNNETVMRLGVIALRLCNLRYKSGSLPENGADMLEKMVWVEEHLTCKQAHFASVYPVYQPFWG